MQRILSYAAATMLMASVVVVGRSAQAASVYGALYEVGNLTSATVPGSNFESVMMYYPAADGFIGITTSDGGNAEWWTSDTYGTTWSVSATNPLTDDNCTQPGRHGTHVYNEEVYFTAACAAGANIYKLTGIDSAELLHSNAATVGYPTTADFNDTLYFFYNGGFTSFDGTTWSDVTTAANQPEGAPFEASIVSDGVIYLAFSTGEVASFDGTAYTIMNEGQNLGNGLAGVEVFNDTIYVGNSMAGSEEGASLYKYDATTAVWEEVTQFDSDNRIVNKMQLSPMFGSNQYLVVFVANGVEGVNIFAVDEDDNISELIDAGLGGTDPENNTEVVDVVRRDITVGSTTYRVMLFSTQNRNDETKVFILNLGDDFAFTPTDTHVSAKNKKQKADVHLSEGSVLKVRVPKKKVNKGDVFTLWVDGEKVTTKTAKGKGVVTLRYKAAKKLDSGDTFTLQAGRRMSYGVGNAQLLARNTILGGELTVQVD